MKNKKDERYELRMSKEEKKALVDYCNKKNIKVSQLLRALIEKEINGEY